MRLGLIARADNSGLGVQTWEIARHLNPHKTLVIDVGHLRDYTTHCNKATYLDRFPDAMIHSGWEPNAHLFSQFLREVDVVLSAECFYSNDFVTLARKMDVRTVLQYNLEFLPHLPNPHLPRPDVFAAPSQWRWDEVPFTNKTFLPVPIATDRFGKRRGSTTPGPRHFLHIVGRPAVFDRNGTPDVLAALRHVTADIRLTIKCQDAGYLHRLIRSAHIPPNVQVRIDQSDTRDYWDNYTNGDVMILPRRYGGLCLPANEALGAAMPVIMTDIDPNNRWLPPQWLVPATKTAEFMAMNHVDVHTANHVALAAKIDQFAADDDFYPAQKDHAADLAKQYSWDQLKPEYQKVLAA